MADAAARNAEQAAAPLAAKLSRTLGRENVTLDLIAAHAKDRAKQAERRTEDEIRRT